MTAPPEGIKARMTLAGQIARRTRRKGFKLSARRIARELAAARGLGRYWVFVYTAHLQEVELLKFSSLRAMARYLVGPAGPLNMFCTYAVAVVNGRVRPYRLAGPQAEGQRARSLEWDLQVRGVSPEGQIRRPGKVQTQPHPHVKHTAESSVRPESVLIHIRCARTSDKIGSLESSRQNIRCRSG